MENKFRLQLVLMMLVVSEASPQQRPHPPPPSEVYGPPPHDGPPLHNLGRHLERLRPLPDRPFNIGLPFLNDNNGPPHRRFENHHSRFDQNQQRMHNGPPHRPIGPGRDDNMDMNKELLEKANNKDNNEEIIKARRHESLRATTKMIIARIKEGLNKEITNLQNFAKSSENNARNRQNNIKKPDNNKMNESTRNILVTSTTPKIRDAAIPNKKNENVETKLDSLNKVDSDLLEQIFGSVEDESSTTESTTEYESTTWDDFNRIGAPPAVIASLLG